MANLHKNSQVVKGAQEAQVHRAPRKTQEAQVQQTLQPEPHPQKIWTISNVITVIRILLVPVFIAVLLAPWPEWFGLADVMSDDYKCYLAAAVFVLISATDWLDGYLARSRGEVTDFGKFMDPLADKILVTAALICLVELGKLPSWVVLIILTREFIVSGVRMMAATKGVVIAASMLGKFKTVFQMIAIVMFTIKDTHMVGSFSDASSDIFWCLSWAVMIVALALTLASLVYYLVEAREILGFGASDASPASEADAFTSADAREGSRENAGKSSKDDVSKGGEEGEGSGENEGANQNQSEPSFSQWNILIDSLARDVVYAACAHHKTIGCAESLTGGMVGESITRVPGASEVFLGDVVSYAEQVKHRVLDVPEAVLATKGAVSEETALAMARGARELLGVDVAVATTGIAGPTGAQPGKPIGTVWVGLCSFSHARGELFVFEGSRDEVRAQACAKALEMLLAEL